MEINELYQQKKYSDILDQNLDRVLAQSYKLKKIDISRRIDELVKTTYSCYKCGAYKELLDLLRVIKSITFADWKSCKADFIHFEFDALLYYLFNPDEYCGNSTDIIEKIDILVPQMLSAYSAAGVELHNDVISRIKVVKDFKEGNTPYYVVSFLYPYAPPFGEGDLNLEGCDPFFSLKIEEVKREYDCFTRFTFKVKGYTNADILWQGHSWKAKERLPVVKKLLPLLNLVLLRSLLAMPNLFIPLYNAEQVSDVTISTFTSDGSPIHVTILGSLFDAHWTGGNIPAYKFSSEEFKALSEDIKNHYRCSNFFIQFYQAKNSMNAGLYVESFLLFSVAAESMFYYWCGEIAKCAGKAEEYNAFSNTKTSSCAKCPYYEETGTGKKLAREQFPGVTDYKRFLNEICKVSSDDCKALIKVYNKAHKTELRNDIVHGRSNDVPLQILREMEASAMNMQELFLRVEEKIRQEQ